MIGRVYLDPGDRLSGRRDPPEPVTVLTKWGPGGGPRNVLVRRADGTLDVIPFPRRLRKMPDPDRPSHANHVTHKTSHSAVSVATDSDPITERTPQ